MFKNLTAAAAAAIALSTLVVPAQAQGSESYKFLTAVREADGDEVEEGRLHVGGPIESLEPRLMRWLKQEARSVLERETREYAAKANVSVSRVGVGDTLSRWGSCSSSGAIRYSWRLILAPDWVRRATVAHEVAHRVHMNHGAEFHALVERLYGEDPTPARQWLRREGPGLHRVGRS